MKIKRRSPWGAISAAAVAVSAIALIARREEPSPVKRRVALIGDSYAVGLGPPLERLIPEFRYEGHVGSNTWQWAHGKGCGECGSWLQAFHPSMVLVSLGVNDGATPDRANYQAIVRAIHGLGARAVWIQPPAAIMTPSHAVIASLGILTVPATTTPLDGTHPVSYEPWAQEIVQVVRGA